MMPREDRCGDGVIYGGICGLGDLLSMFLFAVLAVLFLVGWVAVISSSQTSVANQEHQSYYLGLRRGGGGRTSGGMLTNS